MPSLSLTSIATAAAQFLNILDPGGALSAQQLTDALAFTNALLDNWSSEGLMIPSTTIYSGSFVANQQTLTIGVGGDIVTTAVNRPMAIISAALKLPAGVGKEIKIVTAQQWAAIEDRQSNSYGVKYLYYDRGQASNKGTMYFAPTPLGGSVELVCYQPLTQFADTTTPVTIPPGYERLLKYGCAMEMAPQYSVPIPASVQANFADAMARVRRLNSTLYGPPSPAGDVLAAGTGPLPPAASTDSMGPIQ